MVFVGPPFEDADVPVLVGDDDVDARAHALVQRLLRAVRKHLELDVAFIGAVDGDRRRIEFVDCRPGSDRAVTAGTSDPLDETYCGHILAGRLPQLLIDPKAHPVSATMRATAELPVGSHVGVPIERPDGSTYGTLCCFAHDVHPSLDRTAIGALSMIAEIAADHLETLEREDLQQRERRTKITRILDDPAALSLLYQPVVSIETLQVVALEALSRFRGHGTSPAVLYEEATSCGLGVELEMIAIRAALADLERIPAPIRLNVNVSPETLYTCDLREALSSVPPDRLVVEVTEHAVIEDYTQMRAASRWLGDHGIWLAIDDVGMGFSGLNRILETEPEELKLDAAVIRDIESNPVKQALVEMFCTFGRRAGFGIIAEGIETDAEYETLRELGAPTGQGYHLWRPSSLEDLLPFL